MGVFKIKAYGLLPKHARRDCLKFSVFEAAGHPDLVQVTATVAQDFFWFGWYSIMLRFCFV